MHLNSPFETHQGCTLSKGYFPLGLELGRILVKQPSPESFLFKQLLIGFLRFHGSDDQIRFQGGRFSILVPDDRLDGKLINTFI